MILSMLIFGLLLLAMPCRAYVPPTQTRRSTTAGRPQQLEWGIGIGYAVAATTAFPANKPPG
jgi:hypothetical protein